MVEACDAVDVSAAAAPAASRRRVDTVIMGRWVATMAERSGTSRGEAEEVLQFASVVIDDGCVLDVLATDLARERYDSNHWVDRSSHHLLLPGLINAHTHAAMTLLRGKNDDAPLDEWLQKTVWPIEMSLMSEDFCRDGVALSAVEMLRSGTTTFNDMYWYPEATAVVAAQVGIRAVIGLIVLGLPTVYASDDEAYIERGEAVRRKYLGAAPPAPPNVHFAYAPHAVYTVGDSTLQRLSRLSEANSLPLHIHLHETAAECAASEALERSSPMCHRSEHALRPVANLERMRMLDERLVAAHMVQVSDEEIELLARRRVNVVHCPTSNLKLASGFCPVARMLRAGVNVCIGTDGSASNNALDMVTEVKTAAVLAKAVAGEATAVCAAQAIRMATLHAARALQMEQRLGSLQSGKWADVIAVQLGTRAATSPVYCPLSAFVYSANGTDVTDAWVHGRHVVSSRVVTTIDEAAVLRGIDRWTKRIDEVGKGNDLTELKASGDEQHGAAAP